jgi:hypothetical protein
MKFEEWWTKEREKSGRAYVLLGPYALRKVALLAYEEGYKEGLKDVPDPSGLRLEKHGREHPHPKG